MSRKKEIKLEKFLTFYFSKKLTSSMSETERQYISNIMDSSFQGTWGNFRITVERIS